MPAKLLFDKILVLAKIIFVQFNQRGYMRLAELADYKAVMKTLEIYCVEGCDANIDGVKRAFHEQAVMNGSGKDGYVFGTAQNLYDLCYKVGRAPDATWHIEVLDVAGDTAVGRITIRSWHGKHFVDLHELIRENGEWKIIGRTYQEL